jgi:hypothetical protein
VGLSALPPAGAADAVLGAAAAASRDEAGPALRHYAADAGDIAAGQPLWECARYLGWRYLLPDAGMVAAAEVTDEAGEHHLRVLNESELNRQAWQVLLSLTDRNELATIEYEPRYLTVPAMAIAVLWLRTDDEWASFITPIAAAERRFERGRLYAIAEFEALIRPMAVARVAQPDPDV